MKGLGLHGWMVARGSCGSPLRSNTICSDPLGSCLDHAGGARDSGSGSDDSDSDSGGCDCAKAEKEIDVEFPSLTCGYFDGAFQSLPEVTG